MNSKLLWVVALVASLAYGLMFVFVDVNTIGAIVGALIVAALWVAAAAVRRGEVGPRDRSARADRHSGRL